MTREKILAMTIRDPTDTERHNDNLVNGVDVVGDMTPDQMGYFRPFAGWSSYRTPIEGLYHVRRLLPPGRRRARRRGPQRRGRDRAGLPPEQVVGLMREYEDRFVVNASPVEVWGFVRDVHALCRASPAWRRCGWWTTAPRNSR
ncbi:MAG: hypothetical protein M5U30_18885 [Burkholderiaceae bacterium]|nr:hypothetical protein [Burkholderiaceae bacterium]